MALLTSLKKTNPSLKTLLSVGGWTMGNLPFIMLVSHEATMQTFATNAVTVVFFTYISIPDAFPEFIPSQKH